MPLRRSLSRGGSDGYKDFAPTEQKRGYAADRRRAVVSNPEHQRVTARITDY